MADIEAPPQPGAPEQAHRWLPLGALSATALVPPLYSSMNAGLLARGRSAISLRRTPAGAGG